MELTLLWWAGGVAGAVWLAAVVLQRPGAGVPARRCVIIGSCMAVSGFLVTLPSKPPFHAGQGLGMGFALGAVAATLAALACLGAGRIAARGGWLVSIAGATAPACIAVVIALVFLRGVRIDALTGVLLGWLATALVLQGRTAADDLESRLGPALTVGSLFAAAVALTSCLTAFRGASVVHSYAWAALVVIVAVSVPCALLLGGVLARASEAAASDVVAGASGALVIILTTWLATTRAFPSWLAHYEPERAFWCAIVGVAIGSLMAALSSVASKSASPPPWLGHLMLLLAVGATLPAFQLLAGLGVGITAMTAIGAMAVAAQSRDAGGQGGFDVAWLGPALMMVALIAVRVALERYGGALKPFVLSDQYAIVSLLIAALVPTLTAVWACGDRRLWRRPASVILTACWPVALLIVWGAKSLFGAVVGLGLQPVFRWRCSDDDARTARAGVLLSALAMGAIVQFAPIAIRLSDLTRVDRARLVLYVAGVCAVAVVIGQLAWPRRSEDA